MLGLTEHIENCPNYTIMYSVWTRTYSSLILPFTGTRSTQSMFWCRQTL